MTSPGVCPVRTSSLPLLIIFFLLNSLLNRLHSPSHESGNIGKDIRAPVSVLEPKFSLHKWAHGYTCSYRWVRLYSWIYSHIAVLYLSVRWMLKYMIIITNSRRIVQRLSCWATNFEYIDRTCFRDPRPICSECIVRPQLWQCVGRTRLVFGSE